MTSFYTYIYYDPSRHNEPIYVGKGKGDRAWSHLKSKSKKKHPFIQRLGSMKKSGIFSIIGIYAVDDEELALLVEKELISKIGRKDMGRGPLLNLTDGGEGVSGRISPHTPETKAKMSLAKIGVPGHKQTIVARNRIAVYRTGKTHSPECRASMRKKKPGTAIALTGRTRAVVKCPHCNKSGGEGAMQRWHFDNCKIRSR